MNAFEKSIELFEEILSRDNKEEVENLIKEIDQLKFEGTTFKEYLNNFEIEYSFLFKVVPKSEKYNYKKLQSYTSKKSIKNKTLTLKIDNHKKSTVQTNISNVFPLTELSFKKAS